MNGAELSNLVRRGVGQPLASQPHLDGHVGQRVVHHVEQTALDGHRRFTVGVAAGRQEENLGWDADVEIDRGRTRHVVLRVVGVAVAHGVDPFSAATELDTDEVRSCCGVFRERVGDAVSTGHVVRFNAGDGDTVDEKMHDGRGVLAVGLENRTEVVKEGSVDNERITGHQNRWRLEDLHVGLCENDEDRRGVGSDDAGGTCDACIGCVNTGRADLHVGGNGEVAPRRPVRRCQNGDLNGRGIVQR